VQLSAQTASFLALLVSFASLLVAAIGLSFAATQSRHAANATAIATVQHFMIQSRELWDQFDAAAAQADMNPGGLNRRVCDILGHFEVVMTLVAEGVVANKPRRLVEGTIRDSLGHMAERGFAPYVRSLIDDDEVCENLRGACLQWGPRLRNREAVFEMLKIPRSSL
jgi:hypothetical protein